MDRMIFVAMGAAKQATLHEGTTANNLANVNTAAFKADYDAFKALPVVGPGAPTRTYVAEHTVGHDMAQGSISRTDNPDDFALEGKGFFAVQTRSGGEGYSRRGGFAVDANGILKTRDGLVIQGENGPITVPASSSIQLGQDGTVHALLPNGNFQDVGRIKLVNPESVYKGNDGLFYPNPGSSTAINRNAKVVQGAIEESNVNTVSGLMEMISQSRQYDMSVRLMQVADQDEQKATQLLSANG